MAFRTWQLAAAFDTAFAYRRDGTILDEAVFANHHVWREDHYKIAREEFGFNRFRDGLAWSELITGSCRVDWNKFTDRMNQLATLSLKNGYPEIDLVIMHYGLPQLAPQDVLNGRLKDFLEEIAERITRWAGYFSGYIVSVENGYATAMQTDLNHWQYSASALEPKLSWWELFEPRMQAVIGMTKVLREKDPDTPRMACEPFYHCEIKFRDQVRSLRTMLGARDKAAKLYAPSRNDCWGGDAELLTDVGINFYGNKHDDFDNPRFPLSKLLRQAHKRFPHHRLRIAETGNCQVTELNIGVERWLERVDQEVELANQDGCGVEIVTWSPMLAIEDFTEPGKISPGALLAHQSLRPDPNLVKIIRRYTEAINSKRAVAQTARFYLFNYSSNKNFNLR